MVKIAIFIIVVYFSVVIIGAFSSPALPVDNTVILESEARIICKNAYEDNTAYSTEISFFDIRTVSNTETKFIIAMVGKVQNGYGAWYKLRAACHVVKTAIDKDDHYSLENITSFKYYEGE